MITRLKKAFRMLAKVVYLNNRLLLYSSGEVDGTWSENVTEIDNLFSLTPSSQYYSILKKELDAGAHIFCICDNDRISHFSCVSRGSRYVGEINRRIEILDGDIYIYNCFTNTDYRGKGLYAETLRHLLHKYRGRRVIIACLDGNTASLRTIEKVGFMNCGCATYVRFLFYKLFHNGTVFNFSDNR